jgi:hypothetical protein
VRSVNYHDMSSLGVVVVGDDGGEKKRSRIGKLGPGTFACWGVIVMHGPSLGGETFLIGLGVVL